MAVDMFLKIDDVAGESKDSKHAGSIDVLSWSWDLTNAGNAHIGGGAGAGKVNVHNLNVTKYVDKGSTVLALACCNGKHFKQALLTVRKAGDKPLEYLKIKMEDVLVSSFGTGAPVSTGRAELLTENIGFNFAKVTMEYVPQKQDGSGDASVKMGWNIAGNVKM
jgi:type VI secretion system secreted protein Hcp